MADRVSACQILSRNRWRTLRDPGPSHSLARRVTAVLVLLLACARIGATQVTDTQGPEGAEAAECGREGCAADSSRYESSTVVYDRKYFERYNVITAVDMLYRVPGLSGIVDAVINPAPNQPAVRGFGSGGDQILINNKRIAGKTNEIAATLERIQATQVSRIELIRGTTADVDVRSEGTLINIIIDMSASQQGAGSWEVASLISESGKSMPAANLSFGGRRGGLQYLTSLASQPIFELQTRDERFLSAAGELVEQRDEFEKNPQERPYTATGNLIYQFENGNELRLNGLISIVDRLNEETTDRSPVDTSGVPSYLLTEIRSDQTKTFNWEIGAEVAENSLDTDLQIFEDRNGELVALDIFNPDSVVEELRYEAFVSDRWKLGERTSIELGLNAEFSRLTQRGSEIDNSHRFSFIKPRIDFRFDIAPSSQLRLKAERTVEQLNFEDFVAVFDFQDDGVGFGNPNLTPQNAWEYELRYEYRLADDNGVLELRGFLNEIDDHIDKGPIDIDRDGAADTDAAGLLRSAQADIGEARLYGAEFKSSLRMSWIGVPDAMIKAA